MSNGPNYLFSEAMDACTLCSARLRAVPALGIYLVAHRGAIHYPLCLKCIKVAQRGLTPDLLHGLDLKLEKRAIELGLAQPNSKGQP
jgi:hypothetical protein